ncbi:MAG: hypothetical protein CMA44_04170 [Euryarchaeota archaeon]|nr:hypothetical protein [Euryarchaeota archaeon]
MPAPPGRIVCFGEAMLRESEGVITPGGAEFNVACALARIGTTSAWVSVLPEEETIIHSTASEANVHLEIQLSKRGIGRYMIDSEASSVVYDRMDSGFAHLNPRDFDWRTLLSGARWLVMSGITPLLGERPRSAWGGALTFAELDGTLIAMDLNHRPALGTIDTLWEIIRPRMRMFNVLILSAESLSRIAVIEGIKKPENYEENVEALAELRRRFLIPHLCCTFKRPESRNTQRRWSVVAHAFGLDSTEKDAIIHTPIEPLGGGDAWLAGFLDALSEHGHGPVSPLIGAMRGDLLAALSQRTEGDVSLVSRDELDAFEELRKWDQTENRTLTI